MGEALVKVPSFESIVIAARGEQNRFRRRVQMSWVVRVLNAAVQVIGDPEIIPFRG